MNRRGCEGPPPAVAPAVHQDISTCLTEAVGTGGIARDALDRLLAEAGRALADLRQARAAGAQPFLAYADARDDLTAPKAMAADWRARYRRLVVLGTGGANLGGQALAATGAESGRLLFLDNGDGDRLDRLLREPDLDRTGFLVISKSGATAETLAQALLVLGNTEPADVAAVITQPGASPLRRLAARFDLPVLDHDPALGGRFSALSLVGLLPAMFGGVDGEAARDGAQAVLTAALEETSPDRSAPALGAALAVAAMQAWPSANVVLMPYGPNLYSLGLWYRQLWAESLGKDGLGSTPVLAPGPVDQHSQLQLFLDGPGGNLFTILEAPETAPRRVDAALAEAIGATYLGGHRMGDLIAAQARATATMLTEAGRPVRHLSVPAADARAVGALMMHFMLETVLAAQLLGVDPFDQPAVERGKELARRDLEA
ncbi:MAG: glucose-6-phosphate isomerase [Rhodospirillales bacterium]|nr:glucose-6-phosphate isomerase [Rhodospirillales bacterium]